jgi:multidrug resistance efflux pump
MGVEGCRNTAATADEFDGKSWVVSLRNILNQPTPPLPAEPSPSAPRADEAPLANKIDVPAANASKQPAAEPIPPAPSIPPAAIAGDEKPARDPVRTVTLGVVITLLTLFIYHVVSDRVTPYTSQSNIEALLAQIAPQVAGQVIEVGARDNQRVSKGQVLYRIDPAPFEIAVRAAEANMALAAQNVSVSTADVRATEAALHKQKTELQTSKVLGEIVFGLTEDKALSESDAIRARSEIERAAADVARGEADLERAKRKLGPTGEDNPQMQQARIALEQAKLDLQNTTVIAPTDGFVTNLRLSVGQYVNRGQPVLSFIEGGSVWLTAYLRENQLGKVAPGNKVRVAFDLQPGRVFDGTVDSIGWGITRGGETPAGTLPEVQSQKGWLRDPQRFPVRIVLKSEANTALETLPLRNGAQANVLILTNENSWLNPIGRAWLRIVSWMSYFY